MAPLVRLVSSDQQEFTVEPKVAKMSKTVAALMEVMNMDEEANEEIFENNSIPLPNLTAEVLKRVIEWCEYHKNDSAKKEENDSAKNRRWTGEVHYGYPMDEKNQKPIFDLLVAANYLDIKGLMDNVAKTIANIIKGKAPQEIRDYFHIVNDFTKEEEETIRKENSWCDE
ncbi:hypothetical protein PMAYCL1PPCAC_30225 [Pristionchus mayeri]|uniref:Skp1-related protein n=1 Tax=Pristionchus mayeri TaxID=1317129 RepID=A0AAN5IDG8_9BILA|nr:hypothetical protein PMAYCL1PPCAC_30225 [Pristionchus mayeri]